jgi:ABC-type uncharacterized transport system permease subunit
MKSVEAAVLPEPGYFVRGVRKYYRIFRASLIERMVYRADFFINTILRFLPMLTTILLWSAVYAEAEEIRGFSFHQMIAYLLLVHISRMFSSMPGLANSIAHDIRDGSLKKYLVQPLDLLGYLVSYRVAHKTAYIAMSFLMRASFWRATAFSIRFPTLPPSRPTLFRWYWRFSSASSLKPCWACWASGFWKSRRCFGLSIP